MPADPRAKDAALLPYLQFLGNRVRPEATVSRRHLAEVPARRVHAYVLASQHTAVNDSSSQELAVGAPVSVPESFV
jgi:hypothetical protein